MPWLIRTAREPALPEAALVVGPGGRVAYAGPRASLPKAWATLPEERLADCLVLPGLVNAHAHSFQSLLRGLGDDLDFDPWVSRVLYPAAERLSAEEIETGALLAFAEMLLSGITTVLEFFYLTDQGLDTAVRVIEAARRLGLRVVMGRAVYDDRPSAPVRFQEPAGEALARIRALAERYRGTEGVTVVPAPHSPHAATPEAIQGAAALAEELGTIWTMHLVERRDEVEEVARRYGRGPVAWLEDLGVLGPRAVLVHAVWLTRGELERLALRDVALVHNPSANLMLGDGLADLPTWQALGIRTALGTDGGCTNNRLSILDEMRQAALLAKGRTLDGAALGAPAALHMGTRGGGQVLGLEVGALTEGAPADWVALDLRDPGLMPEAANLGSLVVYAASPRAVRHVAVGGRPVVWERRLLTLDEGELRQRVRAVRRLP